MPFADLRGFANKIIGALTITGLLTVGSLVVGGAVTLSGAVTVLSLNATSTSATAIQTVGGVSSTISIVSAGSAAAPARTFNGDLDTGVYSSAANTFDIGVGGQGRVQIDSASVYLRGDVRPYSVGVGNLGLQAAPWVNGFFSGTVSSTTDIVSQGTVGAPSFTFTGDADTGIYNPSANRFDLVTGGTSRLAILSTALLSTVTLAPANDNTTDLGATGQQWRSIYAGTVVSSTSFSAGAGSAGAPSINFAGAGDPTVGIFDSGTAMRFVSGGGTIATLASGSANFSSVTLVTAGVRSATNNTDDLGTAAISYKDIYASGTIRVVNVTSTRLSATGLLENTAALANVCVGADGTFYKDSSLACLSSNPKLKDNLQDLDMDALSTVMSLKPKEWDWKPGQARTGHDIGFDAVQAESVDPRLVAYMEDGKTVKGFRYQEYTAVLTAAIQDLKMEVDALKSQLKCR